MANYAKDQPERKAPLSVAKKEQMLSILIRNRHAYNTVIQKFTMDHARSISDFHAAVWSAVVACVNRDGELPTKSNLLAEIHQAKDANPSLIAEEELGYVDEFLEATYSDAAQGADVADSMVASKIAIETCRELMNECIALDLRDEVLRDGTVPVDVPGLLRRAQIRVEQVGALSGVELDEPFPEGWHIRKHAKLQSIGVKLLNELMGGGMHGGEIGIYLAPYGSSKTTTVCHGVAQGIRYAAKMFAQNEGTRRGKNGELLKPVVMLVFTESDKDHYRMRLLSNLARVPWKRLREMESIEELSDSDVPGADKAHTRYEIREFRNEMTTFVSEQQRVWNAVRMANDHLVIIDCTDSDDSPYRIGTGGMPEVANVIRGYFERNPGCYPRSVWVDHLSALSDRVVSGLGVSKDSEVSMILKRMPREAHDQIAKRFNIPVMLMHQFSGEVNTWGMSRKLHHAHGARSKEIGEYAAFAHCASSTNSEGYFWIECTKHRREPAYPVRIGRVIGQFNRIQDVTSSHTLDRGQILKKSDRTVKAQTAAFERSFDHPDEESMEVHV